MYQKPARLGNILYRFFTLLSLVLTVYFFFVADTGAGMVKKALYGVWMAISIFSTFKVLSDIIGGERRKMHSFVAMMEQWEKYQGGSKEAIRTFLLMSLGLALIKLAIPLILLILPI